MQNFEGLSVTTISEKPLTRSEEKRAQIIDAASRLFVESGYGAVSMDAIAAEANVSKRTVYSHFEDKSSLFMGVMEQHCTIIGGDRVLDDDADGGIIVSAEVAAALPDTSPRTVLTAFCGRFLKILLRTDTIRLYRVILSEAERFPELARTFNENGPKPLIRRLSGYLSQLDADGILAIPDAEVASWRLIAMLKEPWHTRLCLGISHVPSEQEIDRHVADCLHFFLKAYAPSDPLSDPPAR